MSDFPYVVEAEHDPCQHCGAGAEWSVVYTPLDVDLSTTYDDRDEAESLAADLNEAFQRGRDVDLGGQVAEQDRRIEDLRVSLIRAINTALSREGVDLPTPAAATVKPSWAASSIPEPLPSVTASSAEPAPLSPLERAVAESLSRQVTAAASFAARTGAERDEARAERDAARAALDAAIAERDELRARLASWPDDLRVAAIAEAEDEAKRAAKAERERDDAKREAARLTAERDEMRRIVSEAMERIERGRTYGESATYDELAALKDLLSDVVVALGDTCKTRPEVPAKVRALRCERDEAIANRDEAQAALCNLVYDKRARIITPCLACGHALLVVGWDGRIRCSWPSCPSPDLESEIDHVVGERNDYRRRWNGLDVEREKWAALQRENEDLRRRADTAEQALAEATTWRPMATAPDGELIMVLLLDPLFVFTTDRASGWPKCVGWLPIPPYRAKEEQ